jgi:hypothetical protein
VGGSGFCFGSYTVHASILRKPVSERSGNCPRMPALSKIKRMPVLPRMKNASTRTLRECQYSQRTPSRVKEPPTAVDFTRAMRQGGAALS